MKKMSLLKEFVKAVLESPYSHPQAPFVIHGNIKPHKAHDDWAIYRTFPLVIIPEMAPIMKLDAQDIASLEQSGGVFNEEHEILIDIKSRYTRSRFKGSHLEPPDPDEFEANWMPISIDGIALDGEDRQRLYDYLGGELTDKETDALMQRAIDDQDEGPDPDDWHDSRMDRY